MLLVTVGPGEVLHGRRSEREVLGGVLEAVRVGQSGVLVVSGEAGVGKTALVESAVGSASGFRVLRAVGVESEMELAFAALQVLCAPMLDRLGALPAPQRDALGVASAHPLRPADPASAGWPRWACRRPGCTWSLPEFRRTRAQLSRRR